MPLIDLIAGARPNFMKIAPLVRAIEAMTGEPRLTYRLVHTGQHYDRAMSGTFFEQLGLPEPDVNLGVGSGSQAEQTAAIMIGYERVLADRRPAACVVVGDVTSTMACAIVARKMGVPVAHVEGGLRSRDWSMPEEVNRVVTDSVTNWFFTTSTSAGDNLRAEGVDDARIFFVGNTMIDTLRAQLPHLVPPSCWAALGLRPRHYVVLTLHRPANVDAPARLAAMVAAVASAAGAVPVVFPVHPRTAQTLRTLAVPATIHCVEPLAYREFNFLVREAVAVITDSGGVTEETTVLGVPCLTLRDTTERPETVEVGTNVLLGTNPAAIGPALKTVLAGGWKSGTIPERWDGQAGRRIVETLVSLLA